MADFSLPLQAGLRAALVADANVTALVGQRIYDEPPEGVVFPYIRFGDFEPTSEDTDTTEGAFVNFGIEVHSRPGAGRVECASITETVREALHRQEEAVSVAGLVELIWLTHAVTRASDGASYVGTLAFRALIES